MKANKDFYKVVNAVVQSLDCTGRVWMAGQKRPTLKVYYVDSEKGAGCFTEDDIRGEKGSDILRDKLLQYNYCEEVDEDELLTGFPSETNGYDIWQLSMGGSGAYIQIAIEPSEYIESSYALRDMICDEEVLEAAEITEGMNGYPRGLRGCVLLSGCGKTIDEMKAIADRYGVELVSLRRKDGWQLWQCEGKTYQLYDYQDYMSSHDDNIVTFCSFKSYADYLRKTAYDIKMLNLVEEMAARAELDAMADKIENEVLGVNEFIWVNTYHLDRLTHYEREKMLCDHFEYDSNYYTLALDCRIEI